MTEKERKYKEYFHNRGKHLFKEQEGFPINLKTHPTKVKDTSRRDSKEFLVNWGWGINYGNKKIDVPFDHYGNPMPYEGYWEARCRRCVI